MYVFVVLEISMGIEEQELFDYYCVFCIIKIVYSLCLVNIFGRMEGGSK